MARRSVGRPADRRLGPCLGSQEHPAHHGEVAELHEQYAQDRRQRVAPVVDGVDAGDQSGAAFAGGRQLPRPGAVRFRPQEPLRGSERVDRELLAQVTYSVDALLGWRSSVEFDGPIYAGVLVLPGPSMARRLSADVPQLEVPEAIIGRLDRDRGSGVAIGCEHIVAIQESGAFDGIHLIPVNPDREMASRLESLQ